MWRVTPQATNHVRGHTLHKATVTQLSAGPPHISLCPLLSHTLSPPTMSVCLLELEVHSFVMNRVCSPSAETAAVHLTSPHYMHTKHASNYVHTPVQMCYMVLCLPLHIIFGCARYCCCVWSL